MSRFKLLVLDIDNTVFDWVTYYVHAIDGLFANLEANLNLPRAALEAEARAVFTKHANIEYPFLVQEMPSVLQYFGDDIAGLFRNGVEPARAAFNEAAKNYLKPYDDVTTSLAAIRQQHPALAIIALTDSPRYVAMWKLNKLGLLPFFDAIYGLPDPTLPTHAQLGVVLVDPEILLKHVQRSSFGFKGKIRVLPEDYEKPETKGLKTVLMDYAMDEDPAHRRQVLWAGDNLRKDVGLGHRLGVETAWAKYGTLGFQGYLERLKRISPLENLRKHAPVAMGDAQFPQPDYTLEKFSDLEKFI